MKDFNLKEITSEIEKQIKIDQEHSPIDKVAVMATQFGFIICASKYLSRFLWVQLPSIFLVIALMRASYCAFSDEKPMEMFFWNTLIVCAAVAGCFIEMFV